MRRKIVLTFMLIVKFALLIIVTFTEGCTLANKVALYFLLDVIHLGIFAFMFNPFRIVDKDVFYFRMILFSVLVFIFLDQLCSWGYVAGTTQYTNACLYGYSIATLSCKLEKKHRFIK